MKPLAILIVLLTFISQLQADVRFGIDVLEDTHFAALAGKRIGLVANPAAVDARLRATSDVLSSSKNVKLICLFGPEHGIYGDEYAGEKVDDRKDPRTGRMLYSLYGKTHRPTTQALKTIDTLVFDLQDNGCRSYTFINTMKQCMQACAEHNVDFVILDRPNPLGGERIEGPGLDKEFESGVSSLPVPYVHGMTMGELARLTNAKLFPNYKKLKVIKMTGWSRDMIWTDTGHEWVPTSPHVPTPDACFGYASTGILGELYVINIGVGYTLPFELVGAPWIDGEALARALPPRKGIIYQPVHYRPFYGTFKGEGCQGIQMHWTDPKHAQNIVQINYELISLLGPDRLFPLADAKAKQEALDARKAALKKDYKHASTRPFKWDPRSEMFDKVSGSDEPRIWLLSGDSMTKLFEQWKIQCEQFRADRKPYLLY